jgi:hypothetical protein
MADNSSFSEFKLSMKHELSDIKRLLEGVMSQNRAVASSLGRLVNEMKDKLPPAGNNGDETREGDESSALSPRIVMTPLQAYHKRLRHAAEVSVGIFNGAVYGDWVDGLHRSVVFFRLLSLDPYPAEHDVLDAFMAYRLDVPEEIVSEWWVTHKREMIKKFNDRRAAFIRYIKDQVGIWLGCGKCPIEAGFPQVTKDWKMACALKWVAEKKVARRPPFNLCYPKKVTDLVLAQAVKCDPLEKYSGVYVPEGTPAGEWGPHMIVLEAFTLNIIAISFGQKAGPLDFSCCEDTLGGKRLMDAVRLVLRQRALYYAEYDDADDE